MARVSGTGLDTVTAASMDFVILSVDASSVALIPWSVPGGVAQ